MDKAVALVPVRQLVGTMPAEGGIVAADGVDAGSAAERIVSSMAFNRIALCASANDIQEAVAVERIATCSAMNDLPRMSCACGVVLFGYGKRGGRLGALHKWIRSRVVDIGVYVAGDMNVDRLCHAILGGGCGGSDQHFAGFQRLHCGVGTVERNDSDAGRYGGDAIASTSDGVRGKSRRRERLLRREISVLPVVDRLL